MASGWRTLVSAQPTRKVADLDSVDLSDIKTERRIVQKQDLHLLPWMCITYLLSE